jgi:hypothetical protein
MWGSDYPRTITAITYRMSYDFIEKTKELSAAEKAMFLGQNAQRFYGFKNLPELPYIKFSIVGVYNEQQALFIKFESTIPEEKQCIIYL